MQSQEILQDFGKAVAGTSSSAAAGALAATIAGVAGRTAWVTGFEITGGGATAASVILATITGLSADVGSSLVFGLQIPAGVTAALPNGGLFIKFDKPLPASAQNTNIVLSVPSFGAGNTAAAVNLYGRLTNP